MKSPFSLRAKSVEYRKTVLRVIKQANAGHTGGSLSCVDILNVLYNAVLDVSPATFGDPNRDRYLHSKGHSAEALYTVLADRDFFPSADALCCYQSRLAGHPTRDVPGVEHNTGVLGHGLPVIVGMARAARMDDRSGRVFVLLGDGKLAEGLRLEFFFGECN